MMGYLNNLFIYGIEKFAKDISGIIDAVICVDLPSDVVEEKQLNNALKKENIPSMIYYKLPLHLQKTFSDKFGVGKWEDLNLT